MNEKHILIYLHFVLFL